MSTAHISANAGEWSEFYVLIKLLNDATIDVIDSLSDGTESEIKSIKTIQKDSTKFEIIDQDSFFVTLNGEKYKVFKSEIDLKDSVKKVFSCIKTKSKSIDCNENTLSVESGAFNLPLAERLAKQLRVSPRKQNSLSKGDVFLQFSNTDTGSVSKIHDASIKSWLGANPTLFNASKHSTRLTFLVETNLPLQELLKISSPQLRNPRNAVLKSKIKDSGFSLKFHRYSSIHLKNNLSKYDLQDIVPEIVISHFSKSGTRVSSDALLLNEALKGKYPSFSHKWKTLLEICALGMTAGADYTPATNISDNLIVINNKGELCCFFGRNRLQEMLNEIAHIDTPSTNETKHDYGYFYQKDAKIFLDLNFQIRLKPKTNRRRNA